MQLVAAESIPVGGEEKDAVVRAFTKTLTPNIRVMEVTRVQNLSMWQSFAVKRTSILSREIDDDHAVGDMRGRSPRAAAPRGSGRARAAPRLRNPGQCFSNWTN